MTKLLIDEYLEKLARTPAYVGMGQGKMKTGRRLDEKPKKEPAASPRTGSQPIFPGRT